MLAPTLRREPDFAPLTATAPSTRPEPLTMGRPLRPWSVVLALVLVAILGALHLPFPFSGDKALYQFGARVLTESGGVLYVDFWDLKKPGVYLFHTAAGRLFGFTEVGLHLFELCWLLALSLVLVRAVRPHLVHPRLAPAAPLVTIGAYYCVTSSWHLTQPAVVALFPLFLAIWPSFAVKRDERRRMIGYLFGGMAGALAAIVKPETLPVMLGSWALASAIGERSGESRMRALATRFGPGLAGFAIVIAVVALWFAARGALEELVWTTVLFPLGAWELGEGRNLARLLSSARWFVTTFALPLALLLLVPGTWRGVARERFVLEMGAWLVTGSIAILLEPYAWWQFDFLLLIVPVGLLALRGADGLVERLRMRGMSRARSRAVGVAVLLLAFLPGFLQWVSKARPQFAALAAGPSAWVRHYQAQASPHYAHVRDQMRFLREPGAIEGSVYVLGNPVYQLYSGRKQAIPTNGWALVVLPEQRWRELARQLEAARPAYVYVDASYHAQLRERAPAMLDWLARDYTVVMRDGDAAWYARRAPSGG